MLKQLNLIRRCLIAMTAFSLPVSAQEVVPVNLWVADIETAGSSLTLGMPRKLTGDRGVSSQPSFTLDGASILFVSYRDSANAPGDIYRIDLATGAETRITATPEQENSPTVTPDGNLMVIRWVPSTLFREWGPWIYDMSGKPLAGVLPGPDTVGYYVRVDSTTFAMVRPKTRNSVAIFDTRAKTMTDRDWTVANLPPQLVPGARAISYTRTDSLGFNEIRRLDLNTNVISTLTPTLPNRVAHAWTPGGVLLMGRGNKVFARHPGRDTAWRQIAELTNPELQSVTTYVVSPGGDRVILISPVKPQLHLEIQDSLQAGQSVATAVSAFSNQSTEALSARYWIARGPLLGIIQTQRRRTPGATAELEELVARLTGPLPAPERDS
ncbi:MAG: TolB family protein [Gemmatimonadaceae bacterium]